MVRGKRIRSAVPALAVGGLMFLVAGCSAAGTPSVAAPPVTVTTTATATTTVRTTSTVTATVTQTPTSTAAPATLVVPTFQDPANYECTDTNAQWCWAMDLTTTGPCPNGAYVSLEVHKNDDPAVVTTLETTSAPITDPLGGKVSVQLSTSGLTAEGDTLKANVKESRCA
jgi:hypothetical protein